MASPYPASLVDALKGLPATGELVMGKYRLERYLAHGGMGVVAAARHVELDEPVALKFLRPDLLAGPGAQELSARFLREARATIKIRSEHVPRILDVSTTETGVPYIVMELLQGEDVDGHLEKNGPMAVPFAIDVMLQALEGLAAAHALGMIHRDFKPANVFLGRKPDGSLSAKVLDFGIAKVADSGLVPGSDGSMTATNHMMGSPRYMAPEQMRSARELDARADVWAVGVTLYEMLTCTAPFDGETVPAICASILQDLPHPITARRADVPQGLVAAVERCLGKTPDTRFSDVAQVAEAIAPFGLQPAATESAARVRRLLAAGPPGSSPRLASDPRISAAPLPPPAPRMVVAAETSGSWTQGGAHGVPPRGAGIKVGLAVLVGAALLAVLGAGALVRMRMQEKAHAAAGLVASAAAPLPEASLAPSAIAPAAPIVVATSAPSATTAPSATVTAVHAPPPKPKVAAAEPTNKPPAPPATTAPPAAPAPAPAPAPKPTAGGGLWDDRK